MDVQSPVFLNKLKLEKLDTKTLNFKLNERVFLLKNNKSCIFDNKTESAKTPKKVNSKLLFTDEKNIKNLTIQTEFEPYKNSASKNIQYVRKMPTETKKPWPFRDPPKTARIRIEKMEFDPKNKKIKDSYTKREQTPNQKKLEHNYSNIFNDKTKSFEKYKKLDVLVHKETSRNKFETPIKSKEPQTPKLTKYNQRLANSEHGTKISSKNLDFKTFDEIIEMKRKKGFDPLLTPKGKQFLMEKKTNDLPNGVDTEIVVKNIMGRNFSKAKFNLSKMHTVEFYKKSLRSQTKDKKVETFQIRDIGIDFDEEKFKKLYRHNGIHIYEMNLHSDRNDKGILEFKIRKNCDVEDYNSKLSKVNQTIQNEFNVKLITTNKAQRAKSIVKEEGFLTSSHTRRSSKTSFFDGLQQYDYSKISTRKYTKPKVENFTVKSLLTQE